MQQSAGILEVRLRGIAGRELDGLSFDVLILRTLDEGASFDVVYLDDGNIERRVHCDELSMRVTSDVAQLSQDDIDRLFREGLERLDENGGTRRLAASSKPTRRKVGRVAASPRTELCF
mmetsp:Transcript_26517/g.74499  ORF Transcript_26517/g.74499 Transcript_26517/m.74499 type:complete len:119 (-) Transcript_26517:34-390(-)